jgi:hypothetical protein
MSEHKQHDAQIIDVLHAYMIELINNYYSKHIDSTSIELINRELINHANHLKGLLSIPDYIDVKAQLERELMWTYTAIVWENLSLPERLQYLHELSTNASKYMSDNELKS